MSKLLLVLAPWAAAAIAQTAVFQSETRAVQINVAAVNRDGNSLTGLQKENFTVLDDSKPRTIQFFSEETNHPASKPSARQTVIVLDGINTEFIDQSYARTQAIKAIERMQSTNRSPS